MSCVLNFGSLNIDEIFQVEHIVQQGETIASLSYRKDSGGKGANQSVAVAKAGTQVFHVGCVGEDGRFLIEKIQEYGVDIKYVQVHSKEATGRAIIQVNSKGDNCIILHHGANYSIERENVKSILQQFSAKSTYVLLQNEINDIDFIINCAKEQNFKICLNLAPITKESVNYPLHLIDILIVNETEGNELCHLLQSKNQKQDDQQKIDSNVIEQAKKNLQILEQKFPQTDIVITLGEFGLIASFQNENNNSREIIEVPIIPTKVVETTSAGDTFVGYFLSSILKGNNHKDSLKIATKASSICVSRKGAMDSIPNISEISQP